MTPETALNGDHVELDDLALEALAEAYAEPAPQRLRTRLMAEVVGGRERAIAARRVRRARAIGALAATIAVVLAGLLARELRQERSLSQELVALTKQNGVLAARVDEQGRTLAGLRDALDAQSQILRLVGGPRVLTATLAPQSGGGGAGRVLLDATSGDAAVVLTGLTPVPEGKSYELWAIRDKRPPEAAGLVIVNADRGAAVIVPSLESPTEVTAFAVSVEPRGGSPSPTGPIVLVGAVAG